MKVTCHLAEVTFLPLPQLVEATNYVITCQITNIPALLSRAMQSLPYHTASIVQLLISFFLSPHHNAKTCHLLYAVSYTHLTLPTIYSV